MSDSQNNHQDITQPRGTYVTRREFSEFRAEVLGAVERLGEKIWSRLDNDRAHFDAKVQEIESQQATAGRIGIGPTIGICGLVATMLIAILGWSMQVSKDAAITQARQEERQKYNADRTNTQIEVDKKQTQLIETEDARNDAQDALQALLVERLVGAKQSTSDLEKRVDALAEQYHEHTRNGHPHTVQASVDRVRKDVEELTQLVAEVRESRNTAADGAARDQHILELWKAVSALQERTDEHGSN